MSSLSITTVLYQPVDARRYGDPSAHALLTGPVEQLPAVTPIPLPWYGATMVTALRRDCPGITIERRTMLALPGLGDYSTDGPDTYVLHHQDLAGHVEAHLHPTPGHTGHVDLEVHAWPTKGPRLLPADTRTGHPACTEGATAVGRWVAAYVHLAAARHDQPRHHRPSSRARARFDTPLPSI